MMRESTTYFDQVPLEVAKQAARSEASRRQGARTGSTIADPAPEIQPEVERASRTMPWTCPACQNAIRHSEYEATPRPGIAYRCPICRLELVVDPLRNEMTVASYQAEDDDEPPAARTRAERADAADHGRRK